VDTGLRLREKQTLRSVLTGRWTHGEKPQRVKGSCCTQLPLYTQWPRLKSIRGRQYRNASRAGHVEIRSQTRADSGIAALVTTPLRSLVTRAPSDQASHAPGIRLSQGLRLQADVGVRAHIPAHWGPQAPLNAAPPLARELDARVAVAGRPWGLSGQLWIIGSMRIVSIDLESARHGFRNGAEKQEKYLTKNQTENEGHQFISGGQE